MKWVFVSGLRYDLIQKYSTRPQKIRPSNLLTTITAQCSWIWSDYEISAGQTVAIGVKQDLSTKRPGLAPAPSCMEHRQLEPPTSPTPGNTEFDATHDATWCRGLAFDTKMPLGIARRLVTQHRVVALSVPDNLFSFVEQIQEQKIRTPLRRSNEKRHNRCETDLTRTQTDYRDAHWLYNSPRWPVRPLLKFPRSQQGRDRNEKATIWNKTEKKNANESKVEKDKYFGLTNGLFCLCFGASNI